jgi:competence protein ComEA
VPAEPTDRDDPLGLTRPELAPRPADRLVGMLSDLGLSPRAAALGFAVCLVGLLGWWWLRSPAPPPAEADVPVATASSLPVGAPAAPSAASAVAGGDVVLAHAAGAVHRPGLYELVAGDRVADLIEAAGGATRAADLDRVNLAAPVADGSQIVVPRRGEPTAAVPTGGAPPTGSEPPAAPVDLNLAGPEALETLPGVGPATSAAIIEYRDANGPFASVDELIDVPGIGEAKLAALAGLVAV